jgi:branched-chain amino acid transport system permease protein
MNYLLHIIVMTGMNIPVVLGLNLILGRGKILYFGSVGVSLFTAYAIFLTLRIIGSYPIAVLAGLLMAMSLCWLFAWVAIRLDGDAFGILSISAHLSMLAIVINWTSVTRGTLGLTHIPHIPGLQSLPVLALVIIFVTGSYTFVMWRIHRGQLGRALGALAENRLHAESLGISRMKITILAFLIAGVGIVISNTFYPQYIGLLHPNDYLYQVLIFDLMCVVAAAPPLRCDSARRSLRQTRDALPETTDNLDGHAAVCLAKPSARFFTRLAAHKKRVADVICAVNMAV